MPSLLSRDDNSNNNYQSSSSSGTTPYLFFIALGIGVVFINIWVIIGVRYYFKRRRNAIESNGYRSNTELDPMSYVYHQGSGLYYHTRAPALSRRQQGGVPRYQQPRKLLTLQQLDELCPVQKYRTWASLQKQHGLPTEGGISTEAAQALEKSLQQPSVVMTDEVCVDDEQHSPSKSSAVATTTTTPYNQPESDSKGAAITATTSSIVEETAVQDEDTGDTCAICIDSLEPDDDIRALDCHHVFHTDCITPWLTTRRALCPLCKRDYYQGPSEQQQPEQSEQLVSSLIIPPPSAATRATNPYDRSTSPPLSSGRRFSSSSTSSGHSSLSSRPYTIGTTGVTYAPEPTPIYDEIRLEVRDLMSRIRRARENHHSSSQERGRQDSSSSAATPRTLPDLNNTTALADSSSPPSPTTTRSGGSWRFWRTRPSVSSQV